MTNRYDYIRYINMVGNCSDHDICIRCHSIVNRNMLINGYCIECQCKGKFGKGTVGLDTTERIAEDLAECIERYSEEMRQFRSFFIKNPVNCIIDCGYSIIKNQITREAYEDILGILDDMSLPTTTKKDILSRRKQMYQDKIDSINLTDANTFDNAGDFARQNAYKNIINRIERINEELLKEVMLQEEKEKTVYKV